MTDRGDKTKSLRQRHLPVDKTTRSNTSGCAGDDWNMKDKPRIVVGRDTFTRLCEAARAAAVHTVRMRLIAFVQSAALLGAEGGLYARFPGLPTVDESFDPGLSFITITMLVACGMASLTRSVGATKLALPPGSDEFDLALALAGILIFRPTALNRGRELGLFPSPRSANPVRGAASPCGGDPTAMAGGPL